MAVSRKAKEFYMSFWGKPEQFAANLISTVQEKKKMLDNRDNSFHLTGAQEEAVRAYWKKYPYRISTDWCRYYAAMNGIVDPRYIPNTLYFTKIDQYFNRRDLGLGFNDKNYYSRIFPGVRQPRTYVRKIGSLLFDEEYRLIDVSDAMRLMADTDEVIIKPSEESGSGRDISFYKTGDDALRAFLMDQSLKDYIVQGLVSQHPALSAIYPRALNTIRVTTLLMPDGVHVLSGVLRMGAGGNRVDNATHGGVSVGIRADGTVNREGHILPRGTVILSHPDGFVFEGFRVPGYDRILETVRSLAPTVGHFRLVSWDMAVDKDGDIVLIEANMRKGGIAIHQSNNGPLFGDLTDRVLDEVFSSAR